MRHPWDFKIYGQIEVGVTPYALRAFKQYPAKEWTNVFKRYVVEGMAFWAVPSALTVFAYMYVSREYARSLRKGYDDDH